MEMCRCKVCGKEISRSRARGLTEKYSNLCQACGPHLSARHLISARDTEMKLEKECPGLVLQDGIETTVNCRKCRN